MAFMDFTPELSCRHKDIDSEHANLIELINSLHEAMKLGKGRVVVGGILHSLLEYTAVHFANEERIMATVGYPGLYQQKHEHADLLKQVNELKTRYLKDNTAISMETMAFLQKWLTEHIMVSDAKIGVFLASK